MTSHDIQGHPMLPSLLCPCTLMASAAMPGQGKRPNLEPIGTHPEYPKRETLTAPHPQVDFDHFGGADAGDCWR